MTLTIRNDWWDSCIYVDDKQFKNQMTYVIMSISNLCKDVCCVVVDYIPRSINFDKFCADISSKNVSPQLRIQIYGARVEKNPGFGLPLFYYGSLRATHDIIDRFEKNESEYLIITKKYSYRSVVDETRELINKIIINFSQQIGHETISKITKTNDECCFSNYYVQFTFDKNTYFSIKK